MKNVRLFFKKYGPLRFASHLDMNRIMIRLLRLSSLPIWYTNGFNKHPYITFALPLSLGFSSEYEIMDFRLTDDDFDLKAAEKALADVFPKGLEVISLEEPLLKSGKIAFADFKIHFAKDSGAENQSLLDFLNQPQILVEKKTKKGGIKEINLAEMIISFDSYNENGLVCLNLRLPAGSANNINPKLIADEYLKSISSANKYYDITRTMLLDLSGNQFK